MIKKVEDTLNSDTSLCSDGQQGNREAVLAQSSGAAQQWPLCTAGLPRAPAASAKAPVGQRVPPPLASCVVGPPLPRPGHKMFKPRHGGLTLEGHPCSPSPGRLADRQAGVRTGAGKMLAFFRRSCCYAVSRGSPSNPSPELGEALMRCSAALGPHSSAPRPGSLPRSLPSEDEP